MGEQQALTRLHMLSSGNDELCKAFGEKLPPDDRSKLTHWLTSTRPCYVLTEASTFFKNVHENGTIKIADIFAMLISVLDQCEEFLDISYKHPRKVIVDLGQLAEWAAEESVDVNQLEVSVYSDGRENSLGDDEVLSLKVEVITNPAGTTCAGFVNLFNNARCCRYARRTWQISSVVFVILSLISLGLAIWLKFQPKSLELPKAIAQNLHVFVPEVPKWCLAGFMFCALGILAVCSLCFGTCCRPYRQRLFASIVWTCPAQCDQASMPLMPAESDDESQIGWTAGYQRVSSHEFTETTTEYSLP